MRRRTWIVVSLLAAALSAEAHADQGIGANLGLTVLSPSDGGEWLATVGAPGSSGFFLPGAVPGLRVSWLDSTRRHELYVDGGFFLLSGEGFSLTALSLTGNYQIFLAPSADASPYLTGGGGFVNVSFDGDTSLNPTLGLGLGVSGRVADGHGTVRFEVRLDHVFEDDTGTSSANAFSGKIGFDLWSHGQ